MIVTVLAGGWSARAFLDKLEGYVIGVNDSALLAKCDAAVSMDRVWSEHRWSDLQAKAIATWLRTAAVKNIRERPDWLHVFECDHTETKMSLQRDRLDGTNSGACALNRAYQMLPDRVDLVGFDMAKGPNGEAHWHPPYPWAPQGATSGGKFKAWAAQFDIPAKQFRDAGIEVRVRGKCAIPAFTVAA